MRKKAIIIYDLKGKNQVEKVQALRTLYGYHDKSNYKYNYKREGALRSVKFKREKKTVLTLETERDIAKVSKALRKSQINFEIATMR